VNLDTGLFAKLEANLLADVLLGISDDLLADSRLFDPVSRHPMVRISKRG
jgi:hypothetical protein